MTETITATKPVQDVPKPTTVREITRQNALRNTRQVFDDFMQYAKTEDVRILFDVLDCVVIAGMDLPKAFAEGVGLGDSWVQVDEKKRSRTAAEFVVPPIPELPEEVDPEIAGLVIASWNTHVEQFGNDLETAVEMFRAYPDLIASIAGGAPFPEALADAMREEKDEGWEPLSAGVWDSFLDPKFIEQEIAKAEREVANQRADEEKKAATAAAKKTEEKKIEEEIAAFKIMTQDGLNKAVMHNALGRYLEAIMRDQRKKDMANGWRCEPGEYSVNEHGDVVSVHRGNLTHTR